MSGTGRSEATSNTKRSGRLLAVVGLAWLAACGGAAPAPSTAPPARGSASPTPSGDELVSAAPAPEATGGEGATTTPSAASTGAPAVTPISEPPSDPYADLPHRAEVDSGRAQLEAADVRDTVQGYRPHLRKLCWEPKVNAKPEGAETARVAVEVRVAPDGKVQDARVVGGKGYEGLAGCVQEHIGRWRFPRAKQASSLMFPIVFQRGEATYVRVE